MNKNDKVLVTPVVHRITDGSMPRVQFPGIVVNIANGWVVVEALEVGDGLNKYYDCLPEEVKLI